MSPWDDGSENENNMQLPPGFRLVTMAQAMDQQIMEAQELKASVDRFFNELTAEQMHTFLRMMNFVVMNRLGRDTAQFWCGVTSTLLTHKHEVCSSCGIKHDEAEHLAAMIRDHSGKSEPSSIDLDEAIEMYQHHPRFSKIDDDLKAWCILDARNTGRRPPEILDDLDMYNVFPITHKDGKLDSAVECKSCKVDFASLKNRMELGIYCPVCKGQERLNGRADT